MSLQEEHDWNLTAQSRSFCRSSVQFSIQYLAIEFSFSSSFLLHIVCSFFYRSTLVPSQHLKVECVILYILESKGPACSKRIKTHYLYAVGGMSKKT